MPKQYDVLRQITSDSHLLYGSDATFTPLKAAVELSDMMEKKLVENMKAPVYHENAENLLAECGIRVSG